MSKKEKEIIAVDFDGVIHSYENGWSDGSIYGTFIEGAKEALIKLHKRGYKVVVFTCRDAKETEAWLYERMLYSDCPLEVTNVKPKAIAYIDDRAIRFINWKDTLNYF